MTLVRMDAGVISLEANPAALARVLANIVDNAVRYAATWVVVKPPN